jgi:PiT family inorganic phosphate transporter
MSNGDVNTVLIVTVVVTALAFDFTNGFHDTANAMATSIATGALKPKVAVAIAAVLNLVGAFLSITVAATIASGIVDSQVVTPAIVFAGLVGAICWNLVTWLFGLPSSSSHALIGGVVGATLVAAGTGAVKFDGIISKVLVPAVISPVLAGVVALLATAFAYKLTKRVNQDVSSKSFKRGQIASASLVSLAHGTNDAQKTMGVITLALISGQFLPAGAKPPLWVIIAAGTAIAAGTYIGGWRVIRTMGKGLTDISPTQGFAAETAASAVILAGTHFGFPLSTTHVCSGGILGSGLGRKLAEVRWGLAGRMITAWVITLPAAAIVGALVTFLADRIGGGAGVLIMALVAAIFAGYVFYKARQNPVNANNVNDPIAGGIPAAVPVHAGAAA